MSQELHNITYLDLSHGDAVFQIETDKPTGVWMNDVYVGSFEGFFTDIIFSLRYPLRFDKPVNVKVGNSALAQGKFVKLVDGKVQFPVNNEKYSVNIVSQKLAVKSNEKSCIVL